MAIFDDLHEIHSLLSIEGHEPEVVDDEEVFASNHVEELDGLPFGMGNFSPQVQLLHVQVQHAISVITCGLSEGTGNVTFTAACGSGNQDGCTVVDIFGRCQFRQERFVDTTLCCLGNLT